jgi:hypothetical protein
VVNLVDMLVERTSVERLVSYSRCKPEVLILGETNLPQKWKKSSKKKKKKT